MFLTLFIINLIDSPNSFETEYPTVSGMLIVVAPALIVSSSKVIKKSISVLVASIGENSTSSTYFFALDTALTAISIISSGSFRI